MPAPTRAPRLAAVALALALAHPAPAAPPEARRATACAQDQVEARGACVPACSTAAPFADERACECPPGFGKVLFGNGGGECKPVSCGGAPGKDPKLCSCAGGLVKKTSRGKATCVAAAADPAKTAQRPDKK